MQTQLPPLETPQDGGKTLLRRSPLDGWHREHGALMRERHGWWQAECYPEEREKPEQACERERSGAVTALALSDLSSLGKIEVQGPEAQALLDFLYPACAENLQLGECRILQAAPGEGQENGQHLLWYLGNYRFLLLVPSAHETSLLSACYQALAQSDKVRAAVASVTEGLAAIMVMGPFASVLMRLLTPGILLKNLRHSTANLDGMRFRVAQFSTPDRPGYLLLTPTPFGLTLWQRLVTIGRPLEIELCGAAAFEALNRPGVQSDD